jgi:hypothetical protein
MRRVHYYTHLVKHSGIIVIFTAAFLGLILLFPADHKTSQTNRSFGHSDSSAVIIEGIVVPFDEYKLHFDRNIPVTYNYFYQHYGAADHPGFWLTSYEDENPLDWIRKRTLDQLIHTKIIQKLAIDLDLIKPFHQDDLLIWWTETNRKRKEKQESGGIIYGPTEDSFENFYSYFYSNLEIQVKKKLNKTRFKATDAALYETYERIKTRYFTYTPHLEIDYLEFPRYASEQIPALEARVVAIRDSINENSDLGSLARSLPQALYARMIYSDTTDITGEDNPEHERKRLAAQLQPGEIKLVHSKENSSFYIMRCLSRSEAQIYSFDKVKADVVWYYQRDCYDNLLDSLKQSTEVIINPSLYQKR